MEGYNKAQREAIALRKWEESTIQNNFVFSKTMEMNPNLLLGSETTKIILSTKGKENDISKELKSFLYYVETGIVTDGYTDEMNDAVKVIKHNEKARLDFMGFEMYLLEREMQGMEKGIEKGRLEARAEYEAETAKLY